jgi:hypothetical protein
MKGLVTIKTVVQLAAPDGLERTLKLVAALCEASIPGEVQVTVNALPEPCASDAAAGVFGVRRTGCAIAATDGRPDQPSAGCSHRVWGGGEPGCPRA